LQPLSVGNTQIRLTEIMPLSNCRKTLRELQ
jgi:hypothetical protein